MKKSLTAFAALSPVPLHANATEALLAPVDLVVQARAQRFDIQDAQNPGHLDLSANYKFAKGWTANPVVGFTALPGGAMDGTGLANGTEDPFGAISHPAAVRRWSDARAHFSPSSKTL